MEKKQQETNGTEFVDEFDENYKNEEMEKDAATWQSFLLDMEQDGSSYKELEETWQFTKESIKNEYEAVSVYRTYVYLNFRHLRKIGDFLFKKYCLEAKFLKRMSLKIYRFENVFEDFDNSFVLSSKFQLKI